MSTVRVLTLVAAALLFPHVARSQVSCSVLLAVEEKSGQFLSSSALQPADLDVRVNGKPVSISEIKPEGNETTVVIFIDVSGSMVAASNAELEIARRIVAALPPSQPTMLVVFAKQSQLVAPDRSATEKWLQGITRLKSGQRQTALWDSIDSALGTISSLRPIFVVLSDGGDNISKVHAGSVVRMLNENEVRMIWVDTGSHDIQTPEEKQGADETAQVASATGGIAIRSERGYCPSSCLEQSRLAVDAVRAYSRLHLEIPPDAQGTGKLKISVSSNRPELKGARLAYPGQPRNCSSRNASR